MAKINLTALEEQEEVSLSKKLAHETHFTLKEVKKLLEFHRSETNTIDQMEFSQFTGILFKHFGINDKRIFERIFKTFDTDKDSFVSRSEFVRGMNIFLFGDEKEQRDFCFSVYDIYGDGCITKEGISNLLQNSLQLTGVEDEGEDGLKGLNH